MISPRLLLSLRCPALDCVRAELRSIGVLLQCARCGRSYPLRAGYVDVMPPEQTGHTSAYVSDEERFAHTLDYRRVGPPLLGAGVRQRAIRRMLRPAADDSLIELGCGNGKFLVWNRLTAGWAVGVDPAPLFAQEALAGVDLCRADARNLPFGDGAFTAAISIDVLEHLPLVDLEAYLGEARRVLAPGGRLFIYSNTREGSRLDFVVRGARRLSSWLGARGIIDNSRDVLRKSDHVKAIATYPELEKALQRAGFRVREVRFWNGVFQSLIENLLVKLAEAALRRRQGGNRAAGGNSTPGEDPLRSELRGRLRRGGAAYALMRLLTELMWLDIALFGSWRAGPYFLVAVLEEQD